MYTKKKKTQFLVGRLRKLPERSPVALVSAILKVPTYLLYSWINKHELPVVGEQGSVIEIDRRQLVDWAEHAGRLAPKYANELRREYGGR